jgi:hypothetical protein
VAQITVLLNRRLQVQTKSSQQRQSLQRFFEFDAIPFVLRLRLYDDGPRTADPSKAVAQIPCGSNSLWIKFTVAQIHCGLYRCEDGAFSLIVLRISGTVAELAAIRIMHLS